MAAILELVRRDPAAAAPALAALQQQAAMAANHANGVHNAAQFQAMLRQLHPQGGAVPPPMAEHMAPPPLYQQDAAQPPQIPGMPVLPPAMLEKLQAIAMQAKVGGASWPAPLPDSARGGNMLGPRTDSIATYGG